MMAKKIKKVTNQDVNKTQITVKDLKVGQTIYLYDEDFIPYTVLDVGDPFILIEDSKHFACLYRVVDPIYTDIINS